MATLSVAQVRELAKASGQADADSFLELTFTTGRVRSTVDEEFRNRTLSVDCDYGTVLILFDQHGLLRSIEVT